MNNNTDEQMIPLLPTDCLRSRGEPVCQSRNQGGYWKGTPCGNAAKHELIYHGVADEDGCVFPGRTAEVCCGTHIAQALSRNPGASVEDLNWSPGKEHDPAR